MITAIIPAKSISNRVPNKNIIDIGGKPLFEWTFETCRKLKFDKVVVATDLETIKQACDRNNFEVFELSPEDIKDQRTVRELWQDISKSHEGCHVLLQLTSPFRLIDELKKAITLHQTEKYDVVVSVKTEHDVLVDKFGKSDINNMKRLSQTEDPSYYIAGAFWVSDAEYVKNSKVDLQEGNIYPFPVHPLSSIDINTKEDLELARIVAAGYNTRSVL